MYLIFFLLPVLCFAEVVSFFFVKPFLTLQPIFPNHELPTFVRKNERMNLDEEERLGYTIPKEMKQVWAVQLDLARELIAVCERNHLMCWMECGTLLGAVRHKGFIPWDDDMDFVMLRKDYDKLAALAPREFQHPYFFQTTYSDRRNYCGHGILRNVETTAICPDELHKKYCRGIGIDIFILDGFIENPVLRFFHRTATLLLRKSIRYCLIDFSTEKVGMGKRLLAILSKGLYHLVDYRKGFALYEHLFRMVDCDKAERVSVISWKYRSYQRVRKRSCYNRQCWIPFEDMLLPAPYDAHQVLLHYFGRTYMVPQHLPTQHGQRYLDATRPYPEVLEELQQHPEHFEQRIKLLYNE